MRCLGLTTGANKYHMTDEAHQLFLALGHAGYNLAGYEMQDPELDVSILLSRYTPTTVVVQDIREIEGRTAGGADKNTPMRFKNIHLLRQSGAFVVTIIKDAQHDQDYHRQAAEEIGCHGWIIYYHPRIVHHLAPYTRPGHLIRTHHSVDSNICPPFLSGNRRKGCILSGAVSIKHYPLRTTLLHNIGHLPDTTLLPHPGYHRRGCHTPSFLHELGKYKVAICTSSIYGYALRKIIEATACGCLVLTDLPEDEILPEIDENLVRVTPSFTPRRIGNILRELYECWDEEKQYEQARRARAYYDYRAVGTRLARDIESLRVRYHNNELSTV